MQVTTKFWPLRSYLADKNGSDNAAVSYSRTDIQPTVHKFVTTYAYNDQVLCVLFPLGQTLMAKCDMKFSKIISYSASIREVLRSNLGRVTGFPELRLFVGFFSI
jgi:hypothetical protein